MSMLNETMGFGVKAPSFGMCSYSEREGRLSLSYQLNVTVSAKVDNLSPKTEKKLVDFMKTTLGYNKCVVDKQYNTIYVESIDGVNSSMILRYIKSHVDANAR